MLRVFVQRANPELCVVIEEDSVESYQRDGECESYMMASGFIHKFIKIEEDIDQRNCWKKKPAEYFMFDFYEGFAPHSYRKTKEKIQTDESLQMALPFSEASST